MDVGLFDALIGKLDGISPLWGETFQPSPRFGVEPYRRLQRLVNTYGEENVRQALEAAIDMKAVPNGPSAMALTTALVKRKAADL